MLRIAREACPSASRRADRRRHTADGRTRRGARPRRDAGRRSRAPRSERRVRRAPSRSIASTRAPEPPCFGPSSADSPAITTAYGIRTGRCDASRRKRRHIQFMVGTQDQRAAEDIGAAGVEPPCARQPLIDRQRPVCCRTRRVAARVRRCRMRQPHAATLAGRRSNAAASSADADARSDCARAANGETSWPCTRGGVGPRSLTARRSGRSRSAMRPPRSSRVRASASGIVSTVVEPVAVDERDGRFEDRHSPLERVRGGLVGIAPFFRAPLQPLHIVS